LCKKIELLYNTANGYNICKINLKWYKNKMTTKKVDQAVECFKNGLSCSQAILSIYGEDFGMDKNVALKISAPFGGGMARMGETCGAVTGAFMVLGLKYAAVGKEAKEKLFALENEFSKKFKERNSSLNCKQLLNCDLGTNEGKKTFVEKKLLNKLCEKFVQDAAEILEEIL